VSREAGHAFADPGANVERDRLAISAPEAAKRVNLVAKVVRFRLEIFLLPVFLWRRSIVLANIARGRQRIRKYQTALATSHDGRRYADVPRRSQTLAAAQTAAKHLRTADRRSAHVALHDFDERVFLRDARSVAPSSQSVRAAQWGS
jgi:hypothetical protein